MRRVFGHVSRATITVCRLFRSGPREIGAGFGVLLVDVLTALTRRRKRTGGAGSEPCAAAADRFGRTDGKTPLPNRLLKPLTSWG
jgi:hypothetical protein